MTLKNKFRQVFVLIASLLLAVALLCGCSAGATGKAVASIKKSYSEGLTDYYTVTYTDGSTEILSITNGADGENGLDGNNGKDGANLGVEELFEAYLERYPNATYEDFLAAFIPTDNQTQSVANNILLSSLKVYTEFTESYRSFQGIKTDTAVYTGAAVVYKVEDDYTYLITNYHVIYDASASTESKIAKKITCYLYGSESEPTSSGRKDEYGCTIYEYGVYGIDCTYVGGCASADIAVVKAPTSGVKAINEGVRAVEFAEKYQVGQTAIAVGNPNGEGISVTEGVISVDNEFIQLSVDGKTRDYRSIRIDTALYGGNSGGGLFDEEGKLIGIANAGNGDDQNINYAVPLNIVKSVTESIIYYESQGCGTISIITLGVTVRSENSKYVYDSISDYGKIVEDVVINSIIANSIAENLGLTAEDEIKAIVINGNEYAIDRYFDIGDLLYLVREGDEISVVYDRGGNQNQTENYTVVQSDLSEVE